MVSVPIDLSAVSGIIGQVIFWIGYGAIGLGLAVLMGAGYYILSFDHKVTVFQMFGSGKDGVFSFGKPKTNRIKWVKNRTAWRSLWPFMNRRNIEPFDSEYIYPGKQIFAFDLNGRWTPGRVNIQIEHDDVPPKKILELQNEIREYLAKKYKDIADWTHASIEIPQSEETIRAYIQPVPYHIRNWEAIEIRENAREFAEQTFWNENKTLIIALITAAICLALAGVTIYFSYQYAGGGQASMNNLADAIRNLGVIPARPPG